MEWKSRRVEAILEQALAEDKATSDVTTALTIEPSLRAAATIIAKEECVLSGLGCIPRFLDIFARLDGKSSGRHEVISHPEIFDGVRLRKGQARSDMACSPYWAASRGSSTSSPGSTANRAAVTKSSRIPKSSTASAFAKVRPSPSFVPMLVSY